MPPPCFFQSFNILLAKITTLLANSNFYWRKSIFIGELEITSVFFQLTAAFGTSLNNKKDPQPMVESLPKRQKLTL